MKAAANTLDPLNLVHKGGSVLSNIFTPWKNGDKHATPTAEPVPDPLLAPPQASDPVTENDPAALNAKQNYLEKNMAKKSFSQTIFAGDTGGWRPGKTAVRPGSGL